MIFIPCTTGTFALYTAGDGSTLALPVEAWDDNGTPYVSSSTQAPLVAAHSRAGFLRLEQAAVVLPKVETPRQPSRGNPRPRPKPLGGTS